LPWFPKGLLNVLPARSLWNQYVFMLIGDENVFIAVGWCIYFALIALVLHAKNRPAFFVAFALLCCLLTFNTMGCRQEFPVRFGV